MRDILPKRYRKEIKEKLYEIEHMENLSEAEKRGKQWMSYKISKNS